MFKFNFPLFFWSGAFAVLMALTIKIGANELDDFFRTLLLFMGAGIIIPCFVGELKSHWKNCITRD